MSKNPVLQVNVTVSPLAKPPDIPPLTGAVMVGQSADTSSKNKRTF